MSEHIETPWRNELADKALPEPDDGVPIIRWGPETVERRHLFDAWHEAARPIFDTAPHGGTGSFTGGGKVGKMGDLLLTNVDFTAQRFRRTRRHVAESDSFSLQLYARGRFAGTIGDMPYQLAPGRIALFDFGHEHQGLASEPCIVLGTSIPRHVIDSSAMGEGPGIVWPRNSTPGRLLAGALHILHSDMQTLSKQQAAEAAAGFTGLLNGLLGSRHERQDPRLIRRVCLATIERYIEQHLHLPELDVATLCRKFGSSRSRLYALFREHGGIESYIRSRRLARCFRDLAEAEAATTRISKVAERWGFHDHSHFNRLFRRQFALRPTDVLATRIVSRPEPKSCNTELRRDLTVAHQWIRSL